MNQGDLGGQGDMTLMNQGDQEGQEGMTLMNQEDQEGQEGMTLMNQGDQEGLEGMIQLNQEGRVQAPKGELQNQHHLRGKKVIHQHKKYMYRKSAYIHVYL